MRNKLNTYEKGLLGEEHACEYLQNRGMVLITRRYRSPYGEIDLVMNDGDILVFVEVKSRTSGQEGSGFLAITPAKQRRLLQTASLYMAAKQTNQLVRFDAVEITPDGISHIRGAFDASGVSFE